MSHPLLAGIVPMPCVTPPSCSPPIHRVDWDCSTETYKTPELAMLAAATISNVRIIDGEIIAPIIIGNQPQG
jgi:hypothetical protein